jgi:hypothetical protein
MVFPVQSRNGPKPISVDFGCSISCVQLCSWYITVMVQTFGMLGWSKHSAACRTPEEYIDVNLELCLQAAYSKSNIPVRAEDADRAPPFLDSFGVRALMYSGVTEHRLLSSVQVSEQEHVARYKVAMCGGEIAVLTFQLVLQRGVRAAYRGIASESSWVLQRVRGEWDDLQVCTSRLRSFHVLCYVGIKV